MTEIETSIRQESQERYLTYAMSVVTGRALPDVRDGLKPVQRRILYAMSHNLKLKPSGSHRKSAAVVGEVLARYHPHGDVACYEAMVRMAQDFSLRYPLIDGQGNFGSLDGDGAAAYRYTEAKLRPLALDVLGEIDEDTVPFRENFDATVEEPVVLPSRVPQLLMNGATGIAVGMATSIPPHNLNELIKGLLALLGDPELSTAQLTNHIKAPDFPTGCLILNTKKEITEIYRTGRGSVRMRADWKLETLSRGKRAIVITSIPYAVQKSTIVSKIADLIIAKKVPQLVDIRDESTEEIRVVLELATNGDAELALAYLFKHSPLESHFPVNLTALTPNGRPELLSLKECLQYFLDFREQVVEKRLRFERQNLLDRLHILEGLAKIYDDLDTAIKIIRQSSGRTDAAQKLAKHFSLTEIQSFAVVDMRIYQLSKTSIADIRAELKAKRARLKEIEIILKSRKKLLGLVKKDLEEMQKAHGDTRRSKIIKDFVDVELDAADFIVEEQVFAIITNDGWLKRIRQNNDLSTTRLREGDGILSAHAVSTIDSIAFFTTHGYLYVLSASQFPSSSGYGSPIQKLLKFRDGERVVKSFAFVKSEAAQGEMLGGSSDNIIEEGDTFVLASARGMGYALTVEELEGIKKNGKKIMKLRDGDELVAIEPLEKEIAFFSSEGYGLVIKKKEIPVRTQPAIGVILLGVKQDDVLVGAASSCDKVTLSTSNGKEREIAYKTLTRGRRGLRGKKIVSRSQIEAVVEKRKK